MTTLRNSARVIIADDHPVVRRGLKVVIEEDEELCIVAEASDGAEALASILDAKPDVAILDIDMPVMNGLAVARQALAQGSATRIIFITAHPDPDLMRAAMEIGGKGYLLKGSEIDEVAPAIHAVHAGRIYIGSTMAAKMVKGSSETSNATRNLDILTASEKRVLRLLADGLSSKEIGAELAMHYRTVENHRTNMCRKLKLEGSNSLARFALQHRSSLHERLY